MSKNYKNIKIPEDTYISLKDLKKLMLKKGYDALDPEFLQFLNYTPKNCPQCNSKLEGIRITAGYYHCPKCDYKKPMFELGTSGSIALGALIGLGIAGLIYLLTREK